MALLSTGELPSLFLHVLGLCCFVSLTSTLDFYLWKCKLILGRKRVSQWSIVGHLRGIQSVRRKWDSLWNECWRVVPRVGSRSRPAPAPSYPTSIVPLFIVKTKIIGDSLEIYWRGWHAILKNCTMFQFADSFISEQVPLRIRVLQPLGVWVCFCDAVRRLKQSEFTLVWRHGVVVLRSLSPLWLWLRCQIQRSLVKKHKLSKMLLIYPLCTVAVTFTSYMELCFILRMYYKQIV